jgi:hypothetical protein
MATLIVPLNPFPNQITKISLANQACTIHVYQRLTGLYLDLYIQDQLLIGGVICQNQNRIVRDIYLGFVGDLAFIDNAGNDDPYYDGLGTRWSLCYLAESDLIG